MTDSFSERLGAVSDRIAQAATRSGRSPAEITLISVGKTFSAPVVADAVRSGATDLGENRVQEAFAKKPSVPEATWHLIGPLQSNKVRAGPRDLRCHPHAGSTEARRPIAADAHRALAGSHSASTGRGQHRSGGSKGRGLG